MHVALRKAAPETGATFPVVEVALKHLGVDAFLMHVSHVPCPENTEVFDIVSGDGASSACLGRLDE